MINVTKTFLPPQEAYDRILKRSWDKGWITNRGLLVQELEEELRKFLQVSHILAVTNGTLPLQIAIKALGLTGEIITTPFSYVASTSSIVWEGCTPVFVDIHPEFLTIDENKIEAAITPKTSGIIATHVFGNPCAVEKLEKVSKKYNLKVIYDGAHSFGVKYKEKSIFSYGEATTCSFHATKIFHTGEGGAIFSKNDELHEKFFFHHNFGHKGQEDFKGIGINAKMSELQAALGLSILPYMDDILHYRKNVVETYIKELKNVQFLKIRKDTNWNYSYFPIILESEESLIKVQQYLNNEMIFPRRYFYPSLNTLPYISDPTPCPISDSISKRILCLPLSHDIEKNDVEKIIKIISFYT